MIEAWWNAHALEIVFYGGLTVVLWFAWLGGALGDAWRERKQKKRDGLL